MKKPVVILILIAAAVVAYLIYSIDVRPASVANPMGEPSQPALSPASHIDRDTRVARAEMLSAMRLGRPELMIAELNQMGRHPLDQEAVDVLVSAWSHDRKAEPDLNWPVIERLDVRLAIAGQLVRAHINGFQGVPREELLIFGREHLDSGGDIVTTARAIYIVAFAGGDDDIVRIGDLVARTDSMVVFEAGASALASVCSPAAAAQLDRLRDTSRVARRAEVIDAIRQKSAAFRAARCD